MGDMGDIFNAMRENRRTHRAEMLAKSDTTGWTQHTPWHFSRMFGRDRVDWWPSGGKAKFQGRMVYGHRKVAELIRRLKGEPVPKPERVSCPLCGAKVRPVGLRDHQRDAHGVNANG